MSQTDVLPQGTALTVPTLITNIDNFHDAIKSCFSGSSAPAVTVAYMLWVDTSGSPVVLKQRNAANSAWITVFPNLALAYGGLTAAAAAAFITAAPTSAIAAAATTQLVRWDESNARVRTVPIPLGTLSATASFYLHRTAASGALAMSKIVAAWLVSSTTLATSGSNYWSLGVYNFTDSVYLQTGSGPTTPTLGRLAASTYTGGVSIAPGVPMTLSVNQNNGDLATTLAANKVIQLIATKTGSPSSLADCVLFLDYDVTT